MELLAALAGAIAAFVAIYSLATATPKRRILERLERLDRPDSGALPTTREDDLARPFLTRVGLPALQRLRTASTSLLPTTLTADLEHRLLLAGDPLSLHTFLAIELGTIALAVIAFAAALTAGFSGPLGLAVLLAGVALATIPFIALQSAVTKRQTAVARTLSDFTDLIVTMVEAGLSIDAAIWRAVEGTTGPLSTEFRFALREITLGRNRRDALLDLLERTAVPELRTFIHAVLHAQETGVPLGTVLRAQAREIRLKRRQRAEATAAKAPVKMLLLTLFCILPSLMLVILVPAAIRALGLLQS